MSRRTWRKPDLCLHVNEKVYCCVKFQGLYVSMYTYPIEKFIGNFLCSFTCMAHYNRQPSQCIFFSSSAVHLSDKSVRGTLGTGNWPTMHHVCIGDCGKILWLHSFTPSFIHFSPSLVFYNELRLMKATTEGKKRTITSSDKGVPLHIELHSVQLRG